MSKIIHYLIVYSHVKSRLVDMQVFEDGDDAAAAYVEAENSHGDLVDFEIVLVSSDSEETIRLTHGNYFGAGEDTSTFLSGLTAPAAG